MLIEAVEKSITYRWPGGEVCLEPGRPVDLPEDRASRLLVKAPGKVRAVLTSGEDPELVVEPALPCRPIYWKSMNGEVHGPCPVSFMARTGPPGHHEFWLCVRDRGCPIWIQDTLLVSRDMAREQDQGGGHGG